MRREKVGDMIGLGIQSDGDVISETNVVVYSSFREIKSNTQERKKESKRSPKTRSIDEAMCRETLRSFENDIYHNLPRLTLHTKYQENSTPLSQQFKLISLTSPPRTLYK